MGGDNKNQGELFLIPISIEQEFNNDFLLEEDKKKLKKIKNFIVENPKTARKAIKMLNLDQCLQDLNIIEHSNKSSLKSIEDYLKPIFAGENIGLLSDSGTPCIADPGALIVSKAHELNIKVNPLVGPSSIILSLMASGFNGQNFCFHGYVPIEENKKINFLKEIQKNIKVKQETQIFIETPCVMSNTFSSFTPSLLTSFFFVFPCKSIEYILSNDFNKFHLTPLKVSLSRKP
mgnify:CR=1 FL=1